MTPEEKLKELGITLPPAPKPISGEIRVKDAEKAVEGVA
jgi:hypothetical protein